MISEARTESLVKGCLNQMLIDGYLCCGINRTMSNIEHVMTKLFMIAQKYPKWRNERIIKTVMRDDDKVSSLN